MQSAISQIEAGNLFGNRIFDIRPRVHFRNEIVVSVSEELNCSGIRITPARAMRTAASPCVAQFSVMIGEGALRLLFGDAALEHSRSPSEHATAGVGQNHNFDVARFPDIFQYTLALRMR